MSMLQNIVIEININNKDAKCSSGLLINQKYIISPAICWIEILQTNETFKKLIHLQQGKLHPYNLDCNINIIQKDKRILQAKFCNVFICNNIMNSTKYLFLDWKINSTEMEHDLEKWFSMFFVLKIIHYNTVEDININELIESLHSWYEILKENTLRKGDKVYSITAPFGNPMFIDSYSKGIISNIFGQNNCLLLSDCPSAPGAEGSPVYLQQDGNSNDPSSKYPIGIIICSLSWWRGEWIGLTLVANLKPILEEILELPTPMVSNIEKIVLNKTCILDAAENSLMQVYGESTWGTAIYLGDDICLTNSHVLINCDSVKLYWKDQVFDGRVIYKTLNDDIYDLAVIRCKKLKNSFLKPIRVQYEPVKQGDTVYSAGFPLFSKDCNSGVTISKGHLSNCNSFMIKTSCCIHPGASGGAILSSTGLLVGVIVSNARLMDTGTVYPRINMAIPFAVVANIFEAFKMNQDVNVFKLLKTNDNEAIFTWKQIEAKY